VILESGEKVHIVERRFFQEDIQRHFIGQVLNCTEQTVRLKGYTWVFDAMTGEFVRKPELRERIIPLGARLTINVIPPEAKLDRVKYVTDPQRGLVVTDGESFVLDVTEFSPSR
jgi:hypothetical protein